MTDHVCEVCFRPMSEHEDDHWPPRCCHGCPCGETQEPEFEPSSTCTIGCQVACETAKERF